MPAPDLSKLPATLRLEPAEVELAAAKDEGDRSFAMVAYTGKTVDVGFGPMVFDLETMKLPSDGAAPAFRQHDPTKWVGMLDAMDKSEKRLRVRGSFFEDVAAADEVQQLTRAGARWQASVGLRLDRKGLEWIDEDAKAEVNGRSIKGPVLIARNTRLREVSFVPLGADDETDAAIYAAAEEKTMPDKPPTPAVDPMARVNEINAAFGSTDPAFALEAITKGWSLVEAKAERGTRLEAQLAQERTAREKAEKDLAAEKERAAKIAARPSSASLLGGRADASGHPGGESEDPIERFESLVASESERLDKAGSEGLRRAIPLPRAVNLRAQAIHNIARRDPELHRAYLEATSARARQTAAARR